MTYSWKKKVAMLTLVLIVSALLLPILPTPPPASATQVISSDSWGWVNPLPQGNALYSTWGSYASDVFAVGQVGTILRYNGTAWASMVSGTTEDLLCVWGTSRSAVFAVGNAQFHEGPPGQYSRTILHYNGTAWSSMLDTPLVADQQNLCGVWGSSATNVFAVGDLGTILHYDGSSWTAMTSGTSTNLKGIWGSSATNVYAVGDSGTILKYNGTSWSTISSGTSTNLKGIWGSSATNVYAVGDSGTILKYNGTSLASQSSGTSNGLRGIWGKSASDIFAVGDSGTIRHFDGTSWGTATSGTTETLDGVWSSSASDVYAVGSVGTIIHYNGSAWSSAVTSLTQYDLYAVWPNSASDIFAVGPQGTILHYNGTSWSAMSLPGTAPYPDLWAVWGTSSSDVFAAGRTGNIFHYNGSSWNSMTSGSSQDLFGVWGNSSTDVFAVGDAVVGTPNTSTILHYNGTAWSSMSVTPDPGVSLCAVWGSSATDVFATGHDRTILHYNGAWSSMESTPGTDTTLYGVWGSGPSDVFAVGKDAIIRHYNGTAWSSMSGATEQLRDVWGTGAPVSASNPVYAVGDKGTIMRYDGTSWTSMSSGVTQDYNLWTVRPVPSSSYVYAVGIKGTILRYPSRGISSVSPDYGYPNRTLAVTITGANFVGPVTLDFGSGITVNGSPVVASSNQITANITIAPGAAAGARTVTVTEPSLESPSLQGAFSVAIPSVTAVTPNQADQGNTLDVTITGAYLTEATDVGFGSGITVNSKTVNNPTQLTANITIANAAVPGTRTVAVSTPYNTPTLTNGFTVTQVIPTVTSIDPNQGVQGQTALTVTITGTDLTTATGMSLGEGVTIDTFTVDSDTQITTSVTIAADAEPMARDVSISTLFGTATLTGGFTVLPPAPTIASVEPTQGKRHQTMDVVITGTDFTGANDVTFGDGITVNTLTVDDATQITVNISIAKKTTEGVRDVSVTTAGGTGTCTEGFLVKGKKGGGCACGTISEPTPPSELLIGWGIILACAAAAYWAATRVGRQKMKMGTRTQV